MFVYRWEWIDSGLGPFSTVHDCWDDIVEHVIPRAFAKMFSEEVQARIAEAEYRYSWSTEEAALNMWHNLDRALQLGFRLMKYETEGEIVEFPDGQVLFLEAKMIEVLLEDQDYIDIQKRQFKDYKTWETFLIA